MGKFSKKENNLIKTDFFNETYLLEGKNNEKFSIKWRSYRKVNPRSRKNLNLNVSNNETKSSKKRLRNIFQVIVFYWV